MKSISDEILNKYIDEELSQAEISEFEEILKNSEEAQKRLKALETVHRELFKIKSQKASTGFTSLVMQKIQGKVSANRRDKVFIFSISSIIILFSLILIGYAAAVVVQSIPASTQTGEGFQLYINHFINFLDSTKKYLTQNNISILGSIISFGVIISAYFFFESHKRTRDLGKLH